MTYIVKTAFDDLQDGKPIKGGMVFWHYEPGDIFPRQGKTVDDARLEELSSCENARKIPLIGLVENAAEGGEKAGKEADQETAAKPARKPRKKSSTKKELMPGA